MRTYRNHATVVVFFSTLFSATAAFAQSTVLQGGVTRDDLVDQTQQQAPMGTAVVITGIQRPGFSPGAITYTPPPPPPPPPAQTYVPPPMPPRQTTISTTSTYYQPRVETTSEVVSDPAMNFLINPMALPQAGINFLLSRANQWSSKAQTRVIQKSRLVWDKIRHTVTSQVTEPQPVMPVQATPAPYVPPPPQESSVNWDPWYNVVGMAVQRRVQQQVGAAVAADVDVTVSQSRYISVFVRPIPGSAPTEPFVNQQVAAAIQSLNYDPVLAFPPGTRRGEVSFKLLIQKGVGVSGQVSNSASHDSETILGSS